MIDTNAELRNARRLESLGAAIIRYGLAAVLLSF